jgi:hypothetical protein
MTTIATKRFASRVKQTSKLHAPGTTNATAVEWIDMLGYGTVNFQAVLFTKVGLGITAMAIHGSAASNGATPTVIKSHAVGSAPDALGDYLNLEVSQADIANVSGQAELSLRYIALVLTLANAGDKVSVATTRINCENEADGLTADYVS